SHFCEAILSIAARCVTLLNTPSNQVTSTLSSLPHYSAACLPWAHQVAGSPAFEKAALSGFGDLPTSFAIAAATRELTPSPPNKAAPPPATALRTLRRSCATFDPLDIVSSRCDPRLLWPSALTTATRKRMARRASPVQYAGARWSCRRGRRQILRK